MKNLVIISAALLISSQTLAQTSAATDRGATPTQRPVPTTAAGINAYNTAGSEKSNQSTAGIVGIVAGTGMAAYFCSTHQWPTCAISVMGAIESLSTMSGAGGNTDPSRNPLSPDFNVCTYDPTLCPNGNPSGSGNGDPSNSGPAFNTEAKKAIKDLRDIAASQGVNIDSPASIASYAAAHKGDLSAEGQAAAMAMLTPAELERVDKIRKQAASKFSVSSVAVEGGGGGGGFNNRGGRDRDSGIDLAALLKQGEDKPARDTASLDGMQKSLGGEPIGVASDNIFKQVSRRYQTKIKTKIFLQK